MKFSISIIDHTSSDFRYNNVSDICMKGIWKVWNLLETKASCKATEIKEMFVYHGYFGLSARYNDHDCCLFYTQPSSSSLDRPGVVWPLPVKQVS